MNVKISYSFTPGEWAKAIEDMYLPMAEASTEAIGIAAEQVKKEARADIAGAGFSRRWENTLRVDVFPKGRQRKSLNAAAFIHHKIPYAGIFEEGGVIQGKPNMWIPLRWAPKKIGRQRMTPKTFEAVTGRKLFPIVRNGRTYLATSMRISGSGRAKYSVPSLRRGGTGKKGEMRAIPMFIKQTSVTIAKRFNITGIVEKARDRLAQLYVNALKD